ncbi:MAG: amidohydrolase [Bryobacterales bacterium]|nr:amidohydrolase [Bryobacterales bacterium]
MIDRISGGCACLAVLLAAACGPSQRADLIAHGGKIVTVDPQFRIAQAIAVRGGRILAVGSDGEVLRLAGPDTVRVDLQGRTVLPGLMDSHTHVVSAAMYEFDHPVPEMETIGDVLQYIQSRAAASKPGEWIELSQVFITRLKEQRYPTRQELDRAAPRNPVVFSTGPDASLNSLALKHSGIDRNFQITDGRPGRIERDPKTGEPTGILRSCSRFIKRPARQRTPSGDDYLKRVRMLLADYNSVGITSIADGDTSEEELELFRQLKARGELTCRTFAALHVDAQMPVEKIEARIRAAAQNPLHRPDNMLWLGGIKSYLDGGMLTGSAYMQQPWGVSRVYSIADPQYRGMLYIPADRLYRMARTALENGLQFTVHAVGDGAVAAIVDAYERVNRDLPVRDRRPCITHANFIGPESLEKMGALGVVANLQPDWLYLDGATLLKQFGEERMAHFQPYRTLFEKGVTVGGGSDHMQKIGSFRSINQYNPFLGMWITLTRRPRWTSQPLHPEQRISREQAIRLYTTNNAYLMFAEKERGSLEQGKLADFIVLNTDILTCPEDEVKNIEVERTYLGGRLIYERRGGASAAAAR